MAVVRRGLPAAGARALNERRFAAADARRRADLFTRADDEVRARNMAPPALAAFAYDAAAALPGALTELERQTEARIEAQDRADQAERRAAELQRRIDDAMYLLTRPGIVQPGVAAVVFHDLRLILEASADTAHRGEAA
jgi:hypothetical protein